jgi:hypothetical protein
MPMIIASAVINAGRNRVPPASKAASAAVLPDSNLSFEKLTTRTLFDVATRIHMMAPVGAGTLMVVCVTAYDPYGFLIRHPSPLTKDWLNAGRNARLSAIAIISPESKSRDRTTGP